MNTKLYRALMAENHLRQKVHREGATEKPTETQDPTDQEEKKTQDNG